MILTDNERLLLVYMLTNVVGFRAAPTTTIADFCAEKGVSKEVLLRKLERSLGIRGDVEVMPP